MVPTVIGMALRRRGADGHQALCGRWRTTHYRDVLARNVDHLEGNRRVFRQVAASRTLVDLPEVRTTAAEVLRRLDAGTH